MPRYVYILLGESMEGLVFTRVVWACVQAFNMVGLSFDLLGLHVMVSLVAFRSSCAHYKNLVIW